jgi:hypothetical protein
MVVKQKICSEFSDVFGWYKRRPWHLKKWSFFQIQKGTVAAEEVILSKEHKRITFVIKKEHNMKIK